MGATYSRRQKGEQQPIVMGCYGIGVSRLVATAVEQNHDQNGITWPMAAASATRCTSFNSAPSRRSRPPWLNE